MIYLCDNPLLKEPLKPEHVKKRLLGHWGSSPGLAFMYVHLNRLIAQHRLRGAALSAQLLSSASLHSTGLKAAALRALAINPLERKYALSFECYAFSAQNEFRSTAEPINKYDQNAIFLAGPGHGAPGVLAPVWLEDTYGEIYPDKGQDLEGMRNFFRQFSFPGGIGSHCTPETPGSIHEGGELGYSLSHATGAAFDNPDLLVAVAVGDGEAETGPLATGWHGNKFINPVRDGAVLPILHLNGYKINNPTLLSRIPHEELEGLLRGYGWTPYFVEGDAPLPLHRKMAATMEHCLLEIHSLQQQAHSSDEARRALWPMIVLRTPKGWTGGRWTATRWKASGAPIRCLWRRSTRIPPICSSSSNGFAVTNRRNCSMTMAGPGPS